MVPSTSEPNAKSIVRPRVSVLAREVGGEMVLLDVEFGTYYGLNEVGTRAWSLLAEGATLGEIEERLHSEFDVDQPTLEADLGALVRDLLDHGLIDVVPSNLSVE